MKYVNVTALICWTPSAFYLEKKAVENMRG